MTTAFKRKHTPEINLENYANRSVRSTVRRADELAEKVMELVLSRKKNWTLDEVEKLNKSLDDCDLKISDLLKKHIEERTHD